MALCSIVHFEIVLRVDQTPGREIEWVPSAGLPTIFVIAESGSTRSIRQEAIRTSAPAREWPEGQIFAWLR